MGLALVVGGCGEDEPERSPLAESLAALCDEARADTEALGLPSEKGFSVIKPGAERGLRLAAEIKKLEGTTPAEKEQIASLAEYFRFYHNEIKAGARIYELGQPDAYRDHGRAGETVARERRGARNAHGRARVRRAAVPRPLALCGRLAKTCVGQAAFVSLTHPAGWFLGSVVKGGVTGNRRFPASGSARSAAEESNVRA